MGKEPFDLEEVYDEQIAPLMTKIIEVCKEHKMPFVAAFQYVGSEEEGGEFCSSAYLPGNRPIHVFIEEVWQAIRPKHSSASPMNLTVRNADGAVTQMITILP